MRTTALVALAAAVLSAAPAHAAATIVINNVNGAGVGFNDGTPVAPVGDNPGTTLGAQRLFAFQAAANIWGALLNSNVTIVVNAQFTALQCSANSAVLGSAGATNSFRNFPNAPATNVWYPVALANSLAGSDLNGANGEINANFNVNLGNAGCLTGIPFYLGADNNPPGNSVDLVAVLLHEFGHGLGFATIVNSQTGAQAGGFPDTFEQHLFDNTTGQFWPDMTDPQRQASALNARRVAWDGAEVEVATPSFLGLGVPTLTVTAPAPVAGDKLIATAQFGPAINAAISAPVVVGLDAGSSSLGCNAIVTNLAGKIALLDAGTCSFPSKVKRAQTAGALAVLVADDGTSLPPAPLDGSDGTITIPSARITQADGTALKANLGGLAATLQLDATRRRGADASGRPLTFNPSPLQPGSSVSHWDTSASPNLLMEPSLNGDLGYDVDLTLPAFEDIGWPISVAPPAPTLSVNDVTLTEGNSGTANATFTVALSSASASTVTVQYATAPGTATAATDYTTVALKTLSFAPGVTSLPVVVKVKGDTKDEDDETFFVNLSNASGASIADAQGVGTIADNDAPPVLSAANIAVAEGSAVKKVNVVVKLTPASGRTVTVAYATANGTATTANNDYTATSGTLTFTPGQASKTVPVTINGDHAPEPDETLSLNLSAPVNATLAAPGKATLTLTNDDAALPPLTASIGDATVTETDTGTVVATFAVTLSRAATDPASLTYATADGTAVAPADYTAKTGTLTFNPGQTSKNVTVSVKGDKILEPNETFTVTLSAPVGLSFADPQGVGTILNNDAAPTLSVADKSVTEGNTGMKNITFTVTLSAAALATVTANWATAAAGPAGPTVATPNVDFTTANGTVTFAPGQTSRTFLVAVTGDTLDESDETFLVNLSAPANATLADGQAVGTIVDNE